MTMRQDASNTRRVRGAVAVARVAEVRSAFQRRAVVALAVGLALEALILAARFLGQ